MRKCGFANGVDMKTIQIKDEFIKLGQALKLAGMAESGVDAKVMIQEGMIRVNGEEELRRGKKLKDGDLVEYKGEQFQIKGSV